MTGIGGDTAAEIRAKLDELDNARDDSVAVDLMHDALRAVLDLKRRWDSQPQDLEQDAYAGGHEDGYDAALNDVLRLIAHALEAS